MSRNFGKSIKRQMRASGSAGPRRYGDSSIDMAREYQLPSCRVATSKSHTATASSRGSLLNLKKTVEYVCQLIQPSRAGKCVADLDCTVR